MKVQLCGVVPFLFLANTALGAPELMKVSRESRVIRVDSAVLQYLPEGPVQEGLAVRKKDDLPHVVALATFANPCSVPDEEDLVRQVKSVEKADGKTAVEVTLFSAEEEKICTADYSPVQVKIAVWQTASRLESDVALSVNGVPVKDETTR